MYIQWKTVPAAGIVCQGLLIVMEWITVIGLILLGIFLLVAEVIFIPGTTFVGIAGFICVLLGIYLGYNHFGTTTGSLILAGAILASVFALYYSFKTRSWERFSLKGEHTARFNDDYKLELKVGDKGVTISSLKPTGKAIFQDKELEVRSEGGFISENRKIEIIKIDQNKIIVTSIA